VKLKHNIYLQPLLVSASWLDDLACGVLTCWAYALEILVLTDEHHIIFSAETLKS
jgi:hypothetical protein